MKLAVLAMVVVPDKAAIVERWRGGEKWANEKGGRLGDFLHQGAAETRTPK
jgi:hypothetical protein